MRGFYVGLLGLEPRKTAPKTVVLPLHHRPAVLLSECKFKPLFNLHKLFYQKNSFFFHFLASYLFKTPEDTHKQQITLHAYFYRIFC